MRTLLSLSIVVLIMTSCKQEKKESAPEQQNSTLQEFTSETGNVNVLTQGMEFIVADTLNSGWNSFVYENHSPEVHFILMDLYPEGKTAEDTKNELLPPFDDGMRLIIEGDMDGALAAFGKIPTWFQEVKYMGGTGLISPNKTANSTIYLEPGLYIMECYVKMADGTWHTSHGMYKEIIVSEKATGLNPPAPTARIEISSTDGIVLKDSLSQGNQVFEVVFQDQVIHENFVGHDVNLVKYNTTANIDSLVHWMNWMNPKGLSSPVPEGFTFLGGMNNLSSGNKGYFKVELDAGNYVLISETPMADEKKLFYAFLIN